ncbi:hypothetical protein EO216_20750 [Flammeovirga kamogawensis]|nr:hypothetical protein EO216_20750 [Flammeovirga kamogawensis]
MNLEKTKKAAIIKEFYGKKIAFNKLVTKDRQLAGISTASLNLNGYDYNWYSEETILRVVTDLERALKIKLNKYELTNTDEDPTIYNGLPFITYSGVQTVGGRLYHFTINVFRFTDYVGASKKRFYSMSVSCQDDLLMEKYFNDYPKRKKNFFTAQKEVN